MNNTASNSFTVFLNSNTKFPQFIFWGVGTVIILFLIITEWFRVIELNQEALAILFSVIGVLLAFARFVKKLFSYPFKTLAIFSNHLVLIDHELNEHYLDWDKVLSVEIDLPKGKTPQTKITLLVDKSEIDKPFFNGKIEFTNNDIVELSNEQNATNAIEFLKKKVPTKIHIY